MSEIAFQFQYGAIKGFKRLMTRINGGMFQFQYGAIKGLISPYRADQLGMFQFQYGAIKGLRLRLESQMEEGFNSSMVRLRVFLILVQLYL